MHQEGLHQDQEDTHEGLISSLCDVIGLCLFCDVLITKQCDVWLLDLITKQCDVLLLDLITKQCDVWLCSITKQCDDLSCLLLLFVKIREHIRPSLLIIFTMHHMMTNYHKF